MKIMIVDDSTAMRMIVRKTLRLAGFEGHELSETDDGVKIKFGFVTTEATPEMLGAHIS